MNEKCLMSDIFLPGSSMSEVALPDTSLLSADEIFGLEALVSRPTGLLYLRVREISPILLCRHMLLIAFLL